MGKDRTRKDTRKDTAKKRGKAPYESDRQLRPRVTSTSEQAGTSGSYSYQHADPSGSIINERGCTSGVSLIPDTDTTRPPIFVGLLTGNKAICTNNFDWSNVSQVQLEKNLMCDWNKGHFDHFSTNLGLPSITIDNTFLPVAHPDNVDDFLHKANEILRLIYKLSDSDFTEERCIQTSRPGVSKLSDDSGDEGQPDPEITPAFDHTQWEAVKNMYFEEAGLQHWFGIARNHSFGNHSGKMFVEKLLQFLCMNKHLSNCVNHSTVSAGQYQPGSSSYIREVIRSIPSSTRSTPTLDGVTSTSSPKEISCCGDVVYFDSSKGFYTIVVEIKSNDKDASETQITDQMFGLFRSQQQAMLGLVFKPNLVSIHILCRQAATKHLDFWTYNDEDLYLLQPGILRDVARLILAFIHFVDC